MASALPINVGASQSAQPVAAASTTSSKSTTDAISGSAVALPEFSAILNRVNPVTPPNAKPASATVPTMTDITAKIAALMKSGTPLATIIEQITSLVSSAVQKALPQYAASASAQIKTSLKQSLANALSPPSNAPPGTAAEGAAALATRLQNWLASVAREAEQGTGQQSDISGKILDAISARETPAQSDPAQSTNINVVAAVLANSLLATVAASLKPAASSSLSALSPASTKTSIAKLAASTQAQSDIATSILAPTSSTSGPSLTPSADASSNASANAQTTEAAITIANAPDLLARMLVRAASASASAQAPAPAPVNPQAVATTQASVSAGATAAAVKAGTPANSSGTPTSVLAARFAQALAQIVTAPVEVYGGGTATDWSGSGLADNSDKDATPTLLGQRSDTTLTASPAVASTTLATHTPSIATVAAPAQIDTSALVEQVVKSMTMRTQQDGTTEIRLQLSPENLGQITMKLTVQGNSISASVVAQNADVRSALLGGHQDLAHSLGEAGLTLSGFSVDVSGGDAGNGGNQDRAGGFGPHYMIHEFPANADPSADAIASTGSSFGPPLVGDSGLELFNYMV